MKTQLSLLAFFVLTLLTSCEVVGGIFKAGMGFGIFIVVFIIVLIAIFIFRSRK